MLDDITEKCVESYLYDATSTLVATTTRDCYRALDVYNYFTISLIFTIVGAFLSYKLIMFFYRHG